MYLYRRRKLYALYGVRSHHWFNSPFLDVFYWKEDKKYIWEDKYETKKSLKTDVFPVVYRPFGKKKYPAPRDPRAFLTNTIGTRRFLGKWVRDFNQANICATGGYDYILGRYKNKTDTARVFCAELLSYFPFVRHTRGPGGAYCQEDLVVNGTVVSTFVRSSQSIPIC